MKTIQIKSLASLVILLLVFSSCSKSDEDNQSHLLPPDHPLMGYWVGGDMVNDTIYVFTKSSHFETDTYGIAFFSDGQYKENKNAGFCGTPPIVYKVFDGNWNQLSENKYGISVGFWNGIVEYQVELESLEETTLKCRIIYLK